MSPGGRKQVVFAGLGDDSSLSSSGGRPSRESLAFEEDVWVKREEPAPPPPEEEVQTTGVVIAQPHVCPVPCPRVQSGGQGGCNSKT